MQFSNEPADPAGYLPNRPARMVCIRCERTPEQIPEYVVAAEYDNTTPDEWVWQEEGTLNPVNGHFACTECYLAMGAPSGADGRGGPGRWTAP